MILGAKDQIVDKTRHSKSVLVDACLGK